MNTKSILLNKPVGTNALRLLLVGVGISISGCGGNADGQLIADQQKEIARLRVENQDLLPLRKENEEVQRLRKENRNLAKLRGQAQELARLQAENEQLRGQLAKTEARSR